MLPKITVITLFIGLLLQYGTHLSADTHLLAFSKRLGVTVLAEGAPDWCQEQLGLTVDADSNTFFTSEDLAKLVKVVGSKVLPNECPQANGMHLTGRHKGEEIWVGSARKDSGWAVKSTASKSHGTVTAQTSIESDPQANDATVKHEGHTTEVEPTADERSIETDSRIDTKQPIQENAHSLVTNCDRLAGHPEDETHNRDGVKLEDIKADEAIAVCKQAILKFPDIARLKFQYGRGLWEADKKQKAIELFEKAGSSGHTLAQAVLGGLYRDGKEVPQDNAKAMYWLRRAAKRGNARGQLLWGRLYLEGKGLPQDNKKAAAWIRKAAEQGYVYGQVNMAWLYREGKGVPQDNAKAAEWYRKAAEQGNATAQASIGWMYMTGNGVPQDNAQAMKWFQKAAGQGEVTAQANLGGMYKNGMGVPKDNALAAEWYQKAAEQGEVTAQLMLAKLHEAQEFPSSSPEEARRWYAKAAAQGNAKAKESLERLRRKQSNSNNSSDKSQNTTEEVGIDSNKIVFKNISCGRGHLSGQEYNHNNMFVDEDVAIWDHKVARALLRQGAISGKRVCATSHNRISVTIDYKTKQDHEMSGAYAQVYGVLDVTSDTVITKYTNKAADQYERNLATHRRRNEAQAKRAVEEKKRAQSQMIKQLDTQRANQARRNPLLAFIKNSGVDTTVPVNKLTSNPFVYDGAIIAIEAMFSNMISKDEALFGRSNNFGNPVDIFIVSKVPTMRFTEKKKVLLAAHVIGNKTWKTPLGGEASLAHLKFVDSFEGKYTKEDLAWALNTSKMSEANQVTQAIELKEEQKRLQQEIARNKAAEQQQTKQRMEALNKYNKRVAQSKTESKEIGRFSVVTKRDMLKQTVLKTGIIRLTDVGLTINRGNKQTAFYFFDIYKSAKSSGLGVMCKKHTSATWRWTNHVLIIPGASGYEYSWNVARNSPAAFETASECRIFREQLVTAMRAWKSNYTDLLP